MLTVTNKAKTLGLVLLQTVKDRLGITDGSADATLDHLLDVARVDIEDFTGRVFAKQVYTETVKGYGDVELMLSRFPTRAVTSISNKGEPVVDFSIDNPEAGILFRENGWEWTALVQHTLTRVPIPNSEVPEFTVVYTAGWSLPGDDYSSDTISFDSTDSSINDSALALPVLALGDSVVVSGSTSNDGTFTVVTWTAGKIVVSEATVTEAAGTVFKLTVRDLPANVEEAAFLALAENYRLRDSASGGGNVIRKKVGDLEIEYSESATQGSGLINAIPLRSEQKLQRYVVTV